MTCVRMVSDGERAPTAILMTSLHLGLYASVAFACIFIVAVIVVTFCLFEGLLSNCFVTLGLRVTSDPPIS